MKPLCLTINGRRVNALVEPRTHLADFLREFQNLTGTHLGCEHGVCGACTVLIDGEPARACITFPLSCEGASITSIEGLDDDAVIGELRTAFSREHALQCGFCTPGMLIAARDVVLRADHPTERDIRVAMSGNLCRCTGYVGIVRAITSVVAARRERGTPALMDARSVGPVGSNHARPNGEPAEVLPLSGRMASPAGGAELPAAPALGDFMPASSFDQSFVVRHPIDAVWAFFGRLPEVAACLPGAHLTSHPGDPRVAGTMRIKVGPVAAEFRGNAEVDRDPSTYSGTIRGSGRDSRSSSATRGLIRYRLTAVDEGSTRVDVTVGYTLTGALAQFGRSDLVEEIANRLITTFVRQLEDRLARPDEARPAAAELDAGSIALSVLIERIKRWFRRFTR